MLTATTNHQPAFATRQRGDVAARIEILAADLIDLNAEGDARRQRLIEMGWSPAFLDEHERLARQKANHSFVRDVHADAVPPGSQPQDRMVEIIESLFPATQFVVAELQARGLSKHAIDLHLRKAKARAALSWIHQGAH
jgi:hypothetical protein